MFVVRKGIMTIPDKTSASITNIQSPIKQDMFFAKMSYLLYSIINNSVFDSVLPTNTIRESKLEKALKIIGFSGFCFVFCIFSGCTQNKHVEYTSSFEDIRCIWS